MSTAIKSRITLRAEKLKALRAALKQFKSARVRVGVLGNKADRFDINTSTTTKDKMSNPYLGLIHEFGSKKKHIPARSFLRMPLTLYLGREVNKVGKEFFRVLVLKGATKKALDSLGLIARNIIDRAFTTHGFGSWTPNAESTIKRKGSSAPLIDTAQLRKSVTWRVEPGRASP